MAHVITAIHDDGGILGASFPDFPGATTVAADLDTLMRKAAEMLAFHVAGMAEDGDPIPEPRTLQELRDDPAFAEAAKGAILARISVDLPADRLSRRTC